MKLQPISIDDIQVARQRIFGAALRVPLVQLNVDEAPAEIWLKLENLQPVGSFKIRGAANALRALDESQLVQGVWTASAGNMGQGVAWCARQMGVRCVVVVPDNAPAVKVEAIERLGATIVEEPFDLYQQIQRERRYEGIGVSEATGRQRGDKLTSPPGTPSPPAVLLQGRMIHPFADEMVMAGNGTIGLEILEDLPDVDTVVIPYGGGGLSCGIASAIRAVEPGVKVYAAEVETGAPLTASLAAGAPTEVDYHHSFVTGMGAPFVFPAMWPLASQLLDGSLVVSLAEVTDAVRLMVARNHVTPEGAGAVALATALSGQAGRGRVVCVVSGGNIETSHLITILQGAVPS